MMCLTLRNAVAVLDHRVGWSPVPGYTRTEHHIGHLSPGDWWFPGAEPVPRIVTGLRRRGDRIVLTDQYGITYYHPDDAVLSTAVPDPRVLMTAAPGADGGTIRPRAPLGSSAAPAAPQRPV
jgi:hypothetical protein